jgi:hypothetical protein
MTIKQATWFGVVRWTVAGGPDGPKHFFTEEAALCYIAHVLNTRRPTLTVSEAQAKEEEYDRIFLLACCGIKS